MKLLLIGQVTENNNIDVFEFVVVEGGRTLSLEIMNEDDLETFAYENKASLFVVDKRYTPFRENPTEIIVLEDGSVYFRSKANYTFKDNIAALPLPDSFDSFLLYMEVLEKYPHIID